MADSLWSRTRTIARRLIQVLTGWSVLVGLGVVPTAGAILAAVAAFLSHDPLPFLIVGLLVAAAGNLLLGVAALSLHGEYLRVKEVADHIDSVRRRYEAKVPDRWLPVAGDLGHLRLGQAEMEDAYSRALAAAQVRIADDVELSLSHVGLLPVVIVFFDGRSRRADRHFVATADANDVGLQSITRGLGDELNEPRTPWRTDDSWIPLVRDSWMKERPFRGNVNLSPARPYNLSAVPDRTEWGAWLVAYRPEHEAVSGPNREYGLNKGAATLVQ